MTISGSAEREEVQIFVATLPRKRRQPEPYALSKPAWSEVQSGRTTGQTLG
jgi:hypothetical protein